jgi:hypothetical protein
MYRFVHISFAFAGVPKMRDLEPAMSLVGDWVRYSALSWIVWTDKRTEQILATILPFLDGNDNVFIVGMVLRDSMGRLPPWVWAWINSKTSSPSVTTGNDVLQRLMRLAGPTD